MKVFASILLISLFGLTASAQDYDFRVMVNSGDNKVLKEGETSWSDLKNGMTLFSGDRLQIAEGGYIVLIHKSGSHVELNTAGEEKVSDIVVNEEEGLSSKYIGYVMSKMAPEEQEKNRKKYSEITGATERGFKPITIYMNSSSPVFSSNVVLRWTDMGTDKKYHVTLENMFDDIITEMETNDNRMMLNLDNKDLEPYQLIIVSVYIVGDKAVDSEKYSIQRIKEDELGNYKSEYEDLSAVLDKESPMSYLILAEFFEDHNLLLDAATCYDQALSKSNGIDYFQEAYIQFLMRNGWGDAL